MNYKKNIMRYLVLSLFLSLISLVLMYPEKVGLCMSSDKVCIRSFYHKFGYISQLIFYYLLSMDFILVGLYFSGKNVLNVWKKFAVVYLIFAIILISITPNAGDFLPIDKKFVTMWTAGIFFIASIIIILIKKQKHSILDRE